MSGPTDTAPPTPRTTPTLVQGIVSVQSSVDLTPFIAVANEITTDICTYGVTDTKTPYSDNYIGSRMELIERWLSAHFYSIFDNQLSHAKAGTVAVGYQYKVDLGLQVTLYGQQAMLLDTNGGLAAWNNSIKITRKINVGINWLGRRFWDNAAGQVGDGFEVLLWD